MAELALARTPSQRALPLQRKCACGGATCTKCGALQRKARGGSERGDDTPRIVHDVLASPGAPLDSVTRAFMEPRFGRCFAAVRVHTDARAARSARAVNAVAYTVGESVVFDSARYEQGSVEGRRLLAHELAHVVQQRSAGATASQYHEVEADTAADAVIAGRMAPPLSPAQGAVQKSEGDEKPAGVLGQVVSMLGEALPFGATAQITPAAISGFVSGAWDEVKDGAWLRFMNKMRSFSRKDFPSVVKGYLFGLFEGVVSPITDIFNLIHLIERFSATMREVMINAYFRASDIMQDASGMLGLLEEAKGAISQAFHKVVDHPLDTISALLALRSDIGAQAKAMAGQVGYAGGRKVVKSLLDTGEEEEKKQADKTFTVTGKLMEYAGAARDAIVNSSWARIGARLGYAVGAAVINIAMLFFTGGVGNAITKGAAALGEFSKSLGFLEKAVGGVAKALEGVGAAVTAVGEFADVIMGKLLKPLAPVLEPVMAPFGRFVERLKGVIEKIFGVARKEAAHVAEAGAAKGAGALSHAPTPHAPTSHAPTAKPAPQPHATAKPGEPHAPATASGSAPRPREGDSGLPRQKQRLPEGVSEETRLMLEKNPDLADALSKNPAAARALTLCKSPCIPEFATRKQVEKIESLLAEAQRKNLVIDQRELKEFFHAADNRTDLRVAIADFESAVKSAPRSAQVSLAPSQAKDIRAAASLEAASRRAEELYIRQLKEAHPQLKQLDIRPVSRSPGGKSGAPDWAWEERMRTTQGHYSYQVYNEKGQAFIQFDGLSPDGWIEEIKVFKGAEVDIHEIVAQLRRQSDFAGAYGLKGVRYSVQPPSVAAAVEAQIAKERIKNAYRWPLD